MQRAALAQRHAHQIALGLLGRLADRLRHLARLAVAEADAALLVADHDQRREAEPAAALDHLGHAVDVHELVDELAVAIVAVAGLCPCWPRATVIVLPNRLEFKPASRAASASALTRP